MAPLPPDTTARFRVNYSTNTEQHDFQVRSTSSPSAVGTIVDTFLTALSAALFSFEIGTVEFAAIGSNIFLPVTTGIEGNTYGTGIGLVEQRPWFYGFIGRSALGRKWHLDVFGAISLGTNYRWSPGEYTIMDNAIAALQGASPNILGIDGAAVTVYTYANAGVNAHWQRAER
jgi:hypothetical protein